MPDPVDRLVGRVEARFRDLAQAMEAEVRADLSTNYPPSSKPGEHPHRRSGELVGSVRGESSREGDELRITVQATAEHAKYLEASGRPVVSHLPDKWKDEIPRRLEGTIGER